MMMMIIILIIILLSIVGKVKAKISYVSIKNTFVSKPTLPVHKEFLFL